MSQHYSPKPSMSTQSFLSTKLLTRNKIFTIALGTFILAGMFASLLDEGEISVTLTSGNFFLVDNNKGCTVEPHAAYVGYELCNQGIEAQYNLEVEFGDFSNSQFGLAGDQVITQTIDTLAVGECTTLYWYTYYDCSSPDIETEATILITDVAGDQIDFTESFWTVSTIDAGSGGKILSSYLIADTVIGSILEFDCEYSLGALKDGTELCFQAAGNLDFSADCYQLIGSEITYSEIPNVQVGDRDRLYYESTGKVSGSKNIFRVKYYFRNQCVIADTSILKAYSSSVSGQSFKRYNLGQDEINNEAFLPIEWQWMEVEWQSKSATIRWKAEGVQAGEAYQIERSVDGLIFKPIAQAEALSLAVETDEYAFNDTYALETRSELLYYRIKHTDIDGILKYSEIKSIRKENMELAVSFYPNPASEVLNVQYQNLALKAGTIRIFNINGESFFSRRFDENDDFDQQIQLDSWPKGEYFLEVICGDQRYVKAFIKM